MQVKKGDLLTIVHTRKGTFDAVALEDFDTDEAEWYPVATRRAVRGASIEKGWDIGEEIPCKAKFVTHITKLRSHALGVVQNPVEICKEKGTWSGEYEELAAELAAHK